ncbi:MAG: hypothetical protein FJW31_03500, partial [Acidobacteria bacterium]|nr:hypothetical protein [Acidobacteriota bacterium]
MSDIEISGGAVIADDGSPLHGEGTLTIQSKVNFDGLLEEGKPSQSGLDTEKLVIRYRGASFSFDWTEVEAFEVKTQKDKLEGKVKDGEVELKAV